MPLTEKGKEIMKSMKKQYGKKKAEKIFYASKNAGKITGVDKDMKVKKASLGLLIGSQADKVMRRSKGARKAAGSGMFGLTGLAASKYYKKKKGGEMKKAKVGTFTEFAKGKTGAQASKSEMNKLKNQYMKELSGAVMSENEVQRLKKTMPKLKGGGAAIRGINFKGTF